MIDGLKAITFSAHCKTSLKLLLAFTDDQDLVNHNQPELIWADGGRVSGEKSEAAGGQ